MSPHGDAVVTGHTVTRTSLLDDVVVDSDPTMGPEGAAAPGRF
ncbi:hypothetical protein [Halorubrum sp. DTA98]